MSPHSKHERKFRHEFHAGVNQFHMEIFRSHNQRFVEDKSAKIRLLIQLVRIDKRGGAREIASESCHVLGEYRCCDQEKCLPYASQIIL